MPADISRILAAELLVRHSPTTIPNYVGEFYDLTKSYRAAIYEPRVAALASLHAGIIYATLYAHKSNEVQSVTEMVSLFTRMRSFVIKTSFHSDEVNRYIKAISDVFYQMATRPADRVTPNQLALCCKTSLVVVNQRFATSQYKFTP